MLIRNASASDIADIVSIHQKAFDGFFLTKLGSTFLTELYSAFAHRPGGVLRVLCSENGVVVGFAAGALEPSKFFSSLRRTRALAFFVGALPGLMRHPVLVLKKLWYAVFYKGEVAPALSEAALLSSIAVLPDLAGRSLGKKVLSDFESCIKDNGVSSLFLTTDKFGNEGVVSFYLNNGYEVESEFLQADGRIMLRFVKSFGEI